MAGFHRLFIANRGEVSVRIARTCDELGITPVFGVSAADRTPRGPSLHLARVVQAARQTGITFIGPPAHVMHLMGKKTPAKAAMERAGLTLIPGIAPRTACRTRGDSHGPWLNGPDRQDAGP